ncbi:transcriptional regulator [Granulicella mallensis]|uniref:Transcriptional regulator n=1 Tax=Granulicella mallensis TaxID=940614 RepID=A0A7W8E9L0_9BACT|nr:transcriptional regulator [Granulicella mallensis]
MEKQKTEAQRTNELLEKLIVLQLKDTGVSQANIAKFIGKKRQVVSEMLRVFQSKGGQL